MTDARNATTGGMNADLAARPVLRVGLLGCGNVGAQLPGMLAERRSAIASAIGAELEVAAIAVRSTSQNRVDEAGNPIDPALFTTDAQAMVTDPSIDLIVEMIGGIEPARSLILSAIKAGKPVVTANKELLANHGGELASAAATQGVDLLFEAAAAAAIPIVRPLRESLLGEDIRRVMGIVNGTTNYILTRMTEDGASYTDALAEAQQRGYAERDPTADVEGFDAGAKAAIMASIAFGADVVAGDVYHEGISRITQADIEFARQFDYVIKLLGIAEVFDPGSSSVAPEIGVRVYPAMVPSSHPLASVRGSFNAVFVEGMAAGELMFYGRGAGGRPTASAVMGDLVDAAANQRAGTFRSVPSGPRARIRAIDDMESAYYVGLAVTDHPGVLSKVAGVFGRHGVSILAMQQDSHHSDSGTPAEVGGGSQARLAFITHTAVERDIQATLAELRTLDEVDDISAFLRVISS